MEIDRRLWASSASDNGWSNPYCCVLSPTQIPCSWHQCLLNPKRLTLTPPHVFAIPLQGLWFNSGIISIHFKAWSIAGETKVGDKMPPPPPFISRSESVFGVGRKARSLGCGSLSRECRAGLITLWVPYYMSSCHFQFEPACCSDGPWLFLIFLFWLGFDSER